MKEHSPGSTPDGRNPLLELGRQGQSAWLDFLQRSFVEGGELARLVERDGLAGVTSNPAIFEKAMVETDDYVEELRQAHGTGTDPKRVYERLAVRDVRAACDVLRSVYVRTGGRDGYVSLEVAPRLAHDAAATVAEARALYASVARPNVMIKVPATPQGIHAVRTLLSEGMNVNITLLFSRRVYEAVAEAYLAALEARASRGEPIDAIASVASFFVSRIDSEVDKRLEERRASAGADERARLDALVGKVAVANAKLAYQSYRRIFSGPRFAALDDRGARPQRLLWASTGTKDPRYRDVVYVEELIGRDTVNTMPQQTLAAFRDHGKVRPSLEEDVAGAEKALAALEAVGISIDEVTEALLAEGLSKFVEPFDKLLAAIASRAELGSRPGAPAPSAP